jgi:hypothetical protein
MRSTTSTRTATPFTSNKRRGPAAGEARGKGDGICGTGKDVANVDEVDKVDADCNTVSVINGSRRPN